VNRLLISATITGLLISPSAFAFPPAGPSAPSLNSGPGVGGGTLTGPGVDYGQAYRKRHAIYELLKEGKRIQLADGGKLTDAHRAELQQKLDAIRAGNY
jgi:hypothetical protein